MADPDMPMVGVRLSVLRDLIAKHNIAQDATTSSVCELVQKITSKTKTSLASMLDPPLTAHPTHFVSHAWGYPFSMLVNTLEEFVAADAAKNKKLVDDYYLWVDLVTVSQHATATRSHEWWSTTFRSAIEDIGHTVAVFSPWSCPRPVTRAWCVWELFCSVSTPSVTLSIILPPTERDSFIQTMTQKFGTIMESFSKVDIAGASAYQQSDRDLIMEAVENGVGTTAVNEKVLEGVRAWITRVALEEVQRRDAVAQTKLSRTHSSANGEDSDSDNEDSSHENTQKEMVELLNGVGGLMQLQGKFDASLKFFVRAHGIIQTLPSASNERNSSIHNIANVLREMGQPMSAETLLVQTLQAEIQATEEGQSTNRDDSVAIILCSLGAVLRDVHKLVEAETKYRQAIDILQPLVEKANATKKGRRRLKRTYAIALNGLGNVLLSQGRPQEAVGELQASLDQWNSLGDRHSLLDLATAQNNLAKALQMLGELEEAHELLERALEAHRTLLGSDHPDTGLALFNLADLMNEEGDVDGALENLKLALEVWEKSLNENHPRMAIAVYALAKTLLKKGNVNEAINYFERALRICDKCLPPTHPRISQVLQNLAQAVVLQSNNLARAQEYLERAVEIDRKNFASMQLPLSPSPSPHLRPAMQTPATKQQNQDSVLDNAMGDVWNVLRTPLRPLQGIVSTVGQGITDTFYFVNSSLGLESNQRAGSQPVSTTLGPLPFNLPRFAAMKSFRLFDLSPLRQGGSSDASRKVPGLGGDLTERGSASASISESAETLANSLVTLAAVLANQKKYDEAATKQHEAEKLLLKFAPQSELLVVTTIELGISHLRLTEMDQAKASFEQAYEMCKNPEQGAVCLYHLAVIAEENDDLNTAEIKLNQINQALHNLDTPESLKFRLLGNTSLGRILAKKEQFGQSLAVCNAALDTVSAAIPPSTARSALQEVARVAAHCASKDQTVKAQVKSLLLRVRSISSSQPDNNELNQRCDALLNEIGG